MSEYIPFEIQIEIIKRLPAKSSVQFRLVSKPWNSYIGSREFIISHHHLNVENQPQRLLAWCKDPVEILEDRYVTFFDDDTFYKQDLTPTAPHFTRLFRDSKVIDCSYGLVCLFGYHQISYSYPFHYGSERVFLWNPLIRKAVEVILPDFSYTKVVGFGVCPATFDPTVIKISHGNLVDSMPWKVEVFTLSSGTWKSLESTNLPRKTVNLQSFEQCCQVIIDRFIYWDACERKSVSKDAEPRNVNLIVSFDMTTHVFEVIDLPDNISHPFYMNLSKMRDSIVVVEYIRDSMFDVCAVWVMEDIVTKSFTKLYTIRAPDPLSKTIVGFRKSGEAIMETHYNGEKNAILEVYEPYSQEITRLGIYGNDCSFFASSYMETLLLLDQEDSHVHSVTDDDDDYREAGFLTSGGCIF